jgi:hypothetical protein
MISSSKLEFLFSGMNKGAPEGHRGPAPYVAPVILLGLFSFVFTNKWIIQYISNDL